ncbi:MAG: SMI1/KNR4 family protein [Ancrocorticia sp.]
MMSNDIYVSLASIEAALGRLDRKVLLDSLQDGIPSGIVRSALAQVGLESFPELEALYAWCNGTDVEGAKLGEIWIFPGFYFLPLEDAILNYRTFVGDLRWQVGWLPLFADGGGDFYFVDLGTELEYPIRRFRLEESEHPVEYGSLQEMITTLATAFEREIFYVNQVGSLWDDTSRFVALAAELNPEIDWWR